MATACPLCGWSRSQRVAITSFFPLVRCVQCRLLFADPRPAEVVQRHYDDVYGRDTFREHIDERRRTLFEGFLREHRPRGTRRLLDIGCGTGEFPTLARSHGWDAHGIEVAPEGAAIARRRGVAVHGDVGDLPDGYFEALTLWNVVDFFTRPVTQMQELCRVVAPGGLVFVRAPNAVFQLAAWRLSRVVVWPRPLARLVADAHFFQPIVWSPSTLRRLLEAVKLTDIHLWNSAVSYGDPYRQTSAGRERVVATVKRAVHGVAQGVYHATRGRAIIGSSVSALARKAG